MVLLLIDFFLRTILVQSTPTLHVLDVFLLHLSQMNGSLRDFDETLNISFIYFYCG